jgi:uncharacterized membrane protein YccF (DUF307 family)
LSLFGNILWIIFGGLLTALGYVLGGLVLCLTIVGFPFGIQVINLGIASLAPFGKKNVDSKNTGKLKFLFDIVWLIFFGWEIALAHLASAGVLAVTIIGIPFAYQHLKLIPIALFPLNQKLE